MTFAAPSAASAPAVVSGIVTSQTGVAVPDVSVTAVEPGTSNVRHGPAFTGPDGRFTFAVDTGVYDFRFEPAADSGLNVVVQQGVQVQGDLTINVQLATVPTTPVTHRFSGVVSTHDGLQLQNPRVSLGGLMSNANVGGPGGFALNVPPGVYQDLAATSGLASLLVSGVPSYPVSATITAGPEAQAFDLSSQDVTQDLRMPSTTTLDVTVLDTTGNPVTSGLAVEATGSSSPGAGFDFVPGAAPAYRLTTTESEARTQSNGAAHLQVFTGLTYPAGSICVRGVTGFVDTYCNTSAVTTDSGPASVTLTQPTPPSHTFSGVVRTAEGVPVPHISLELGNTTVRSQSDGRFSITKSPGRYELSVQGGSLGTGPLNIAGLPGYFSFAGPADAIDLTSSDLTTDVLLPPTVTVTVRVNDHAGAPAADIPIDFGGILTDHALLGTGHPMYRATLSGEVSSVLTDSSGAARFTLFRGTLLAAGSGICARFTVSPNKVCNTAALTTDGDVDVTLTQPPPTPVLSHTLSGTVHDAAGTAVPGVTVELDGSVKTDSSGSFRITRAPGTYPFAVIGGGVMGPLGVPGLPDYFDFSIQAMALTSDVNRAVRLPGTTGLTVSAKDINGVGLPGASVAVQGSFPGGFPLLVGDTTSFIGDFASDGRTNAQGVYTTTTFRGLSFAPGEICVTLANLHQCNTTTLDTNAGALTVLFQQQPSLPAIVTGLTASSPTNSAPALAWQTTTNATHYLVQRDGVLLGTATETAFTDTTATDGVHTYTVSAANNAGAGPASAPVIVVVDRARPTVTGSPDRPAPSGWYNSPVTITWSSTDPTPSAGPPSTPAPTIVQAEGRDQAVSSSESCDPASNCAIGGYRVSIDRTPPSLATPAWSANPATAGTASTLTVPVTDTLSGVDRGEYYLGTDPGVGNATPLSLAGEQLTAGLGASLPAGVYDIGIRARDIAGNWSSTTTTMLVVVNPAGAGAEGKNKKDLVPSLAAGDVLPGLAQQGQTDSADYGFTISYRNGVIDPRSDFHLTYATGARCSSQAPVNCHRLAISANSFEWLVIDQDNNSRATFRGTASVTVDGTSSTNAFVVEAIDGDLLTPQADDHLVITIYATDGHTVLYRASGFVKKGNSVRIR
ncbi:carboxypeptidase-like regulatory domain-containing protein [Lentzea aerocolonigenes]|uniref:carboxypeptidase-like regulatory domain-containing protein n=1 Tax=Lentzea aerocolonigenes TaxID=68170 RepID=UPI0012E2C044|nr:carboxypeptidase-like regulatory domain-containing protein [Lentzea aerocolonigenes]